MLTTILMLAGLWLALEIMLQCISKQYECAVCRTATQKRGILLRSCSNPQHHANSGEED